MGHKRDDQRVGEGEIALTTKLACRYVLTLAGTPSLAYELTDPKTTIGRSVDCAIRIDKPSISRIHAEIEITPEGCRIIDRSSNGTFVNNRKITTHLLHPGDVISIGSTALTFSVEEKQSWVFPQRMAFRCVQLTLLSGLFCAILLGYPLDKVATYWGEAWDDMIASARARMGREGTIVAEPQSPNPATARRTGEIRNEPIHGKRLPESIAKNDPDRSQRSNDFQERSRRAVEILRKNVMDDLAANDLKLAEVHIGSFKKGEYYSHHFDTVRELEEKISAFKSKTSAVERERMAKIEERWKKVEAKFREAVSAEQFDSAKELLQELTGDPDLGSRAKALLATVDNLQERYVKETLSLRRDLFTELILKLRSYLQKRDYAAAVGYVKTSLMNDPAFSSHRSMLERERDQLEKAADLYGRIVSAVGSLPNGKKVTIELKDGRIMEGKPTGIKDGHLWLDNSMGYKLTDIALKSLVSLLKSPPSDSQTLCNLYLYETDYPSAALAVVDLAGVDLSAASDFFIRMELFQKALIDEDITEGFAKADKYVADGKATKAEELLKKMGEKYTFPVMAGLPFPDSAVVPKDIAINDGRLPQLETVRKKLEEVQNNMTVGDIPYRRLKLLEGKGQSAEKSDLLKSLKVVGGKEIVPHIIKALDDDSAKVRLEAVRTLSAIGGPAETWELAKMIDDPVEEIAREAIDGIKKIGAKPETIREMFANGTADEKRIAVKIAGALGEEKLEPMAREALGHKDWRVRRESAIALAKLGAKNSGGALAMALKKETFDAVEAAIAYAMGAIKHKGSVASLADLLKRKPNHPFKQEIVRAIGEIGGDEAAKILREYVRDLDPWIRYWAAEGLARSHAKIGDDDVKNLLVDDRWLNRAAAVSAMIAGGEDKSLDTLVKLLDDPHPAVRAQSHFGLLSWSNSKVITEIIKGMDRLGGEGAALAHDILKKLTRQDFATAKEWEAWWRANGGSFRLPPVDERFAPKLSSGGKKQ